MSWLDWLIGGGQPPENQGVPLRPRPGIRYSWGDPVWMPHDSNFDAATVWSQPDPTPRPVARPLQISGDEAFIHYLVYGPDSPLQTAR